MYETDVHYWLDGSLVEAGYTNWYPGQPTHGNNDWMTIRDHEELWTDYNGGSPIHYICEKGLLT